MTLEESWWDVAGRIATCPDVPEGSLIAMTADYLDDYIRQCFDGRPLGGGFRLAVTNLTQGRFAGERNFELFLSAPGGSLSCKPIAWAKYYAGGQGLVDWLEVVYSPTARFSELDRQPAISPGTSREVDLSEDGLDQKLFDAFSSSLHGGGRLFVGYGAMSAAFMHELQLGTPIVVTSLGFLMWNAGFVWFKDWYFAEGWKEGLRKIQGNKPIDAAHELRRSWEVAVELSGWLHDLEVSHPSIPGRRAAGQEGRRTGFETRARAVIASIVRKHPDIGRRLDSQAA